MTVHEVMKKVGNPSKKCASMFNIFMFFLLHQISINLDINLKPFLNSLSGGEKCWCDRGSAVQVELSTNLQRSFHNKTLG